MASEAETVWLDKMRIVKEDYRRGYVKLIPEDPDDLWVLYNIIHPGDLVTAQTTREIKGEKTSGNRRIPMVLTIRVTRLEFQPFTERLRIRGVVVEGPEKFGVKGHYHTLNIEPGHSLLLFKEKWPRHIIDRLRKSTQGKGRILLVALDYDEVSISLVTEQGSKLLYTAYSHISGKGEPGAHDRELREYLEDIAGKIIEAYMNNKPDAIIIGSPGGLAGRLKEFLIGKGLKARIEVDHIAMGGEAGLRELQHRDIFTKTMENLSTVRASRILEKFRRLLVKNPDMVAYGLEDVGLCVENNAVSKIVVSEELIRSYDEDLRRRIERLLEEAYNKRAEIVIVPAHSPISSELEAFTGIIAVLRFPLPYSSRDHSRRASA